MAIKEVPSVREMVNSKLKRTDRFKDVVRDKRHSSIRSDREGSEGAKTGVIPPQKVSLQSYNESKLTERK